MQVPTHKYIYNLSYSRKIFKNKLLLTSTRKMKIFVDLRNMRYEGHAEDNEAKIIENIYTHVQ